MTTEGSEADRRRKVAEVSSRLFGMPVAAAHVIGETLQRSTTGDADDRPGIRERIPSGTVAAEHSDFVADDMTDLRNHVDTGFTDIRGKLDTTAAGQQQIVELLTSLIGDRPEDTDDGQ